jgi:hypothetical protein
MSEIIKFEPKPIAHGSPAIPMATTDGSVPVVDPASCQDAPSPEFSKLDIEALFNLRQWVSEALQAKGAKIVGAGIGCGGTMGIADVQIELDGHQCNIEIRPIS